MSLLTVVNDVCAVVGVTIPTSVFAGLASNRTMAEMLALANEMAQRIATDTRDWTVLRLKATFVGDGVTEAFNLPANFQRMLMHSEAWRSTSAIQPMTFISSMDEWLQRRAAGYAYARGEWIMFGGQIHIWPIMDAGIPAWANNTAYVTGMTLRDMTDLSLWNCNFPHTSASTGTFANDRAAHAGPTPPAYWLSRPRTTAYLPYLDKNPIALSYPAGGTSDRFMNDADTYRLPERILRLGMVWQWKANKGSPYAEDMGTWSDAMAIAMGTEKPAPILIDHLPLSSAARVAYPFPVPTP